LALFVKRLKLTVSLFDNFFSNISRNFFIVIKFHRV
jgi:hypothetical protein